MNSDKLVISILGLLMIIFFYRNFLYSLLKNKKESFEMILISLIVFFLFYLICDILLEYIPNNIR
jgi:hypothetical protein